MIKLRVFLADDHAMVLEGLKVLINAETDMEVVGDASDGDFDLRSIRETNPDVVVMDISMPRMSGFEATRRLRDACPEVKVLILTRHTGTGYIRQLLAVGAAGYLLKQSASSELTRAIRTVASGNGYLDPAITEDVTRAYLDRSISFHGELQPRLSDREREVLSMVAWGYSNKEISNQLGISVKTVEAHKANSTRKLDLNSRIEIVRYALLQGWLKDN